MTTKTHRLTLATLLALLAIVALAPAARADFGVAPTPCAEDVAAWVADTDPCFGATVSTTQAGAHPDQTVRFRLAPKDPLAARVVPAEDPKTIKVNLPPGLAGNPEALPKCTAAELNAQRCPPATQVGVAHMILGTSGTGLSEKFPVYNLVPNHGNTAEFGFKVLIPNVHIVVRVRDEGDYGLTTTISGVTSLLPVLGSSLTFWGVPADPSHDAERWPLGGFTPGAPAGAPLRPFMSNPTQCDEPLTTTWSGDSWQNPGAFTAPVASEPIMLTGCDALEFEPSVEARPDTPRGNAPTGITVDVRVPQQTLNPNVFATPTLEDAVVTLPSSVGLSPGAADGLQTCAPGQFGVGSTGPASCPLASKIGESLIRSPLLSEPLGGAIYLGPQLSGAPYTPQLFVVAEGAGVRIRLVGVVRPDPATGQLTTTFEDTPPLPFSLFRLHFKGGPRAIMALGPACGTGTTTARLTSSAGQARDVASPFAVTDCAASAFAPGFTAGALNPVAGRGTGFALELSRSDGDQDLGTLDVDLPPGVLGAVGRVPVCADAAANAGTCDAASRVGGVTVEVGSGASPFGLPGTAYLTGPYKGAPYGLAFVVPAKAGPIDLGMVVVRAAIHVDPIDASLRVVSDALPTVVGGIPQRIRSVRVVLDRPGFMVNPTNCNPMRIDGKVASAGGTVAPVGSRFQVGGCSRLPLQPRLRLALTGRDQQRDGGHPGLKATLRQADGVANLKRVAVTLPLSVALEPTNAEALCTVQQAEQQRCPEASIVGRARATTPLLSRPLAGDVYFVQGIRRTATGQTRRTLPKLWVALRGDIALDVWADSSVKRNRLVSTFAAVPDAPLSSFELTIDGGRNGILAATRSTCRASRKTGTEFRAHNAKRLRRTARLAIAGC